LVSVSGGKAEQRDVERQLCFTNNTTTDHIAYLKFKKNNCQKWPEQQWNGRAFQAKPKSGGHVLGI
jgi:hypothetical protein